MKPPAARRCPSISSHRGQGMARLRVERAVDDEPRHLLDDDVEVELGDAIALEVGRRVQEVDRVRHAVLIANSIVFIS